jgi:hypothetical protein
MCNIGMGERVLRVIVGLIVISLVFWGPQSAWGWLGLLPLLTGLSGYCPLYAIMGINRCKKSDSPVRKPS